MKSFIKGMFTACLFYPFLLNAQSDIDALRYSQGTFGSTARSLSMGGAFGALGADFSTLSSNPAGIGVYRKSELTFSLGFQNRFVESKYLSNTDTDDQFIVDMPNLGFVLASPRKRTEGWTQFGFAVGYNRTANFNTDTYFQGKNTENSLLDSYVDRVWREGGATEDDLFYNYPFDVDLAYQTYLLDPDSLNPNQYVSVIPNGGAYQSKSISTRGGMGEFAIGFGGTYNEKIHLGISLGFPTINYEEESVYEEVDKDNEIVSGDSTGIIDFRSLRYASYLRTRGNGFNAKFGIIVKPADWIRIGAAIHTPTYYYMHDNYYSTMTSSFGNGSNFEYRSPDGTYSYNLTTPFKAIGSLAFIFGKFGLVSFDYEITDYSASKLKASDYQFSSENKIINTVYSNFASNLRGGIEIKLDNISLRGGAAYYSTPFNKEYASDESDQHMISYTGGIGFRQKSFFVDVAYAFTQRSEYYSPYYISYEDVPGVVQKRTDHRVVTTVGLRF